MGTTCGHRTPHLTPRPLCIASEIGRKQCRGCSRGHARTVTRAKRPDPAPPGSNPCRSQPASDYLWIPIIACEDHGRNGARDISIRKFCPVRPVNVFRSRAQSLLRAFAHVRIRGTGEQYTTSDGRAALAVYSQPNARHETPRSYLSRHNRAPRGTVDYVRVTRSFFAISALYQGMIYYSRCNFSRRPEMTIHCFDLKYPASEKLAWDDIVTRMSRSLQPPERG